MAHDLLLRGPVPIESAVQLQVIGPEGDHRGETGARTHEGEVGARQLEEERRLSPSRRVGIAPEEVGGRPEVPGPRSLAHGDLDAGFAEDRSSERGRRGLAGGARDADARACPSLEHQVAETREARSTSPEQRDPGRDLRRPDIEVRDLRLTGGGIEVDAGLDVDRKT